MQRYRPRRVLAYARVSGSAQEERGTSLEAQQEEFERHCAAHGFPKPRLYVEVEGGGAEKLEKRVECHRLMRDVREGDLVLVSKQDRWSRYTLWFLQSAEQIIARGARFFSIAERFDPSTPEGKFAATQMASVAELEHARIRERTVGSRRRLRAMGKWVEGSAPFGYLADRTARALVIDTAKAPIVRRMFAMCVAGKSTRQISEALQEQYPEVGGLDAAAILRKLRSRLYLGEMRPTARKDVPAKPGDVWISSHPAIIDKRTWRKAQDALDKRKLLGRPGSEESRTAAFLLRGIVRCGHCGYVLKSHSPTPGGSTRHGGWYMCRRRPPHERGCVEGPLVQHRVLDATVETAMVLHLKELADELAKSRKQEEPLSGLPDYESQRESLLARRRRVVDAISRGLTSEDEATETLTEIRTELERLERAQAELEKSQPLTIDDRRRELATVQTLRRAWKRLSVAEKRGAISRAADRILVYSTGKAKWQRRGTWRVEAIWKAI